MNVRDKIKQIINDPHLIKLNDQKKYTKDDLQKILGGFDFGPDLLIINGLMTFCFLFVVSIKKKF